MKKKRRYWLAERRYSAGFKSSRSFAQHIGLSPSYYYEIENGVKNPGGRAAFLIAEALEFDMSIFYAENVHLKRTSKA